MTVSSQKGIFIYYSHQLLNACIIACFLLAVVTTFGTFRHPTVALPIQYEDGRTKNLSILAVDAKTDQTTSLLRGPTNYEYTFGGNGSYTSSNLNFKGLSDPEEGFTWTNSDIVTFEIANDYGASEIHISIYAAPFVSPPISSQPLTVFAEGIAVGAYSLKKEGIFNIELHESLLRSKRIVHIALVFRNAVSPTELHYNNDTRKLALQLRKISISTNTYHYSISDLPIKALKFKTGREIASGVLRIGEKQYSIELSANEEVLVDSKLLHIGGTVNDGIINAIAIWALLYKSISFKIVLMLCVLIFFRIIFMYLVDVFFWHGLYRFVFLFLMVTLGIFFLFRINPHYSADTVTLLKNVHLMDKYLEIGRTFNNGLVHFPLSQFIPFYLLVKAGFADSLIFKSAIAINLLSFLLMLVLFHYLCQNLLDSVPLFYLAAAILLSGYGIWFSIASFNESFAAFIIVISVVNAMSRRNPIFVLLSFVLAGITKEIAPPFIFAFLALSYYEHEGFLSPRYLKKLAIPGVGLLIALLVNALFNVFRYGVVYNTLNLVSYFKVPSFSLWMNSFAGLIFSPNGGLLFFWPTFCLIIIFLYAAIFRKVRNHEIRWLSSDSVILLAVSGLLFVLLVGFAKWWSPFGWVAWGSRLIYPYMPSLFILLLYHFRGYLHQLTIRLFPSADRALLVGVVLSILSVPHVLAICNFDAILRHFQPLVSNPGFANPNTDPVKFYAGLSERMWKSKSILISAFDLLNTSTILFKSICYGAILIAFTSLLYFSRRWTTNQLLQQIKFSGESGSP